MSHKILLVDDDVDDRELFCEALTEINPAIDCYTANGARKALSLLDNREVDKPDIIFLDVNMPIITGWQCLSLLKEKDEYKNIPVIMYSTTSYREDIDKALQLGALSFYTKPSDFKNLKKNLERLLHNLKDQLPSVITINNRQ